MIKVGRSVHGVSINGLEWLLNNEGELLKFNSREKAMEFLRNNGFEKYSDEKLEDNFVFQESQTAWKVEVLNYFFHCSKITFLWNSKKSCPG